MIAFMLCSKSEPFKGYGCGASTLRLIAIANCDAAHRRSARRSGRVFATDAVALRVAARTGARLSIYPPEAVVRQDVSAESAP